VIRPIALAEHIDKTVAELQQRYQRSSVSVVGNHQV